MIMNSDWCIMQCQCYRDVMSHSLIIAILMLIWTHFWPIFPFYTPWKQQKIKGFLVFSGDLKWEHRPNMSQTWKPETRSIPWQYPFTKSKVGLRNIFTKSGLSETTSNIQCFILADNWLCKEKQWPRIVLKHFRKHTGLDQKLHKAKLL